MCGCTKELQQPVLTVQAAPVSNSLRAPAPADPKAKQGRVALPEKNWGTRRGENGVERPLTTANKAVLAAQAKSLNDHPEGLQRKDLQAALDGQMANLAGCFDNAEVTSVGVYFEADPSGQARGVQVRGAPEGAEACVRTIITSLRFPPFKGNSVPVDFPLAVRQRMQNIARPAETTAQGEAPTPFVNP